MQMMSDEACRDAQGRGQCLGNHVGDVLHVAYQAVQHVAAVPRLASVPFVGKQPAEEAQLHVVLRTHAQQGAYPTAGETDADVAHHDGDEHEGGRAQRNIGGASRGDVDAQFRGPDERKVQPHTDDAYDGVQRGLQTQVLRYLPEPTQYATARLQSRLI